MHAGIVANHRHRLAVVQTHAIEILGMAGYFVSNTKL